MATSGAQPINSMRVLHIDDDPDHVAITKMYLESFDPEMEVVSSLSPVDSLPLIENMQFDCIVCDYLMPEMDGIELCRRVRRTSDVPFIIHTGQGSEEVASIAFDAGVDDYIRKEPGQSHFQVLAKRVRQAVEKHWVEGLYRNVLENCRDGVVIVQGTRIAYANQALAKLRGVSLGELMEKDALDWIVERDRSRLQSIALGRQRGESQPSPYEVTFRRPDGEHRVLNISSSLINYKGRPASLGIVRDVSEKVRDRERLEALHGCTIGLASAESIEEIAKLTLDSITEVFDFQWGDFSILEAGRLIPVLYKGVAYEVEILDLDGPGVIARAARTGESQLVPDTRVDEDYIPTFIDGKTTTPSELAVPIKSNGNVIGVINLESPMLDGFSVDDQKLLEIFSQYVASGIVRIRNEGLLKASEEKYRNILESSLDGITVSRKSKTVFANQRFTEMLGYDDPSEVLGRSSWEFVRPEYQALVKERSAKRREGDRSTFRYELCFVTKDGSPFFAETQTSPIDFEGEAAVLGIHRDVNERVRLREESRRSEELLKNFMDSATDGFSIFDSEMNYLDVNKSLVTRSGHPKGYFIGKNILDVLPNLDKTGRLELYREVLETENPVSLYVPSSSHSDQQLSIRAFKVGEGLGIITTDVTYRKQMDEQLRKSEENYRTLLESSLDAITVSVDNKIVYSNKRCLEILGYDDISELKGMRFLDFIHPEDRETAKEAYKRRSKGERGPINYTVRVFGKDGQDKYIELRTNGIEYEGQEAILSIARDITERKRLEEGLRRSEERYRSLIELAPDGIMTLNLKGGVTSINTAFIRLTGYSENDIVGHHFSKLKTVASLKYMPKYLKMFASLLRGKTSPLVEFDYKRKDGTFGRGEAVSQIVEVEPGKREALAILRDISDRTRMEEQLREYTRNLERLVEERTQELVDAERLVAAGKVSAMVGHDLRGPLVVVRNAVDLARKNPEKTDRMLDMIERNAGQAINILEELRTKTRDEPVTLTSVEIREFLGKATEDIFLPDEVEFQVEIDEGLSELVLDEAKTLRALDNLIRNALDAMTTGGLLKIGATRERDKVVIRVSDTGTGIPDETRRNLFKPFYTTKPGGMGLGLASTKRIVEVQGGTISFETRDDKGSTFTITLPLKEKNPEQ